MKFINLPRHSNAELLKILREFYMSPKYNYYANTIYKSIEFPHPGLQNYINNNLITAINSAIVDNLVKWVVNKDPLSLVEGMANGTLPYKIEVGYRHSVLIVSEEFVESRDYLLASKIASDIISQCILDMYCIKTDEFNKAILTLFETLYGGLGLMDIKWYKALNVENGSQRLLVMENTDEDCFN